MLNSDHDELLAGLADLASEPPADLIDRFAARWVRVPGRIGELSVAFTDHGIAFVRTAEEGFATLFRERFGRPLLPGREPPLGLLPALGSGQPVAGLQLDLRGLTEFQEDVLQAARTIPEGEVRPYSWVAREIGRPKAVRAVGSALGNNPVPLLIPCHRVTRADGAVGDYVFGPAVKETLLRSEGVEVDELRC